MMGHQQLSWMCEMEEKFFDVRGRTMNMSDRLLYIRGNLTCDGSPTIMDV